MDAPPTMLYRSSALRPTQALSLTPEELEREINSDPHETVMAPDPHMNAVVRSALPQSIQSRVSQAVAQMGTHALDAVAAAGTQAGTQFARVGEAAGAQFARVGEAAGAQLARMGDSYVGRVVQGKTVDSRVQTFHTEQIARVGQNAMVEGAALIEILIRLYLRNTVLYQFAFSEWFERNRDNVQALLERNGDVEFEFLMQILAWAFGERPWSLCCNPRPISKRRNFSTAT